MDKQRSCVNCHTEQRHRFKFCSVCGNQIDLQSHKLSHDITYDYSSTLDKIENTITQKAKNNYTIDNDGFAVYDNNPKVKPMLENLEAMEYHSEFLNQVAKASKPYTFFTTPLTFMLWLLYIIFGFSKVNHAVNNLFYGFVISAIIIFTIFAVFEVYKIFIDKKMCDKIGKNYLYKYLSYQGRYYKLENIYAKNGKLKCIKCGNAGTHIKGAYEGENSTPGYISCSSCSEILFYT